MADLNTATLPERPFMLFGQMATADPSRSPAGTESAWAYTHLPRGLADDESAAKLSVVVDRVLEEHAPGFTDRVVGRVIQRPSDLEGSDANLHTGAVNGGTSQLYQQLIFRPTRLRPSRNTRREPVARERRRQPRRRSSRRCGRNAARAALRSVGITGWPRRRLTRAVLSLTLR